MRNKSSFLDLALILFIPAAIVAMLVTLWWTQELSRNVHTAIFAGTFIAVMAAGTWSDVRRERCLDEIQIAAVRFGHRWSSTSVALLILASLLPPFQEQIVEMARAFEDRNSSSPPPAVSVFIFGVAAAVLLQQITAALLRAGWLRSKARP